MQELIRRISADAQSLAEAFEDGDKEAARDYARSIMSHTAKAHQRLGILVDLDREARWMAEVDRAVKAKRPDLPGQMSIDEAPPPSPRKRSPRKPKA